MAETQTQELIAEPIVKSVTMQDGRVVEFAGKRRAIKTTEAHDGVGKVRLDFINGETRTFTIPEGLLLQFAVHGASQKLGDCYAGLDTADAVQALDELIDQLYDGKWAAERTSGGGTKSAAGGSSLHKALMELTGKSKEEITAFLAAKSPVEKAALKVAGRVAPLYQKYEAERLAKKAGNGEELLEGLD